MKIPHWNTKWVIAIGLCVAVFLTAILVAGYVLSSRFEPYIRDQAIQYLEDRFDSSVELNSLRIRLPGVSPLNMVFNRGRGSLARVEGQGVSLRHKGRRDI